jgi:hypothetical protein
MGEIFKRGGIVMARPRKISADVMLQIVDSFFESHGDPGKMKCSNLEEHACSLGFNIKAYDFRRSDAVRQRIEELRHSVWVNGGSEAVAYKSMDVDALINRNNTREMMKNSLLELDEAWRGIYERAAALSSKNVSLLSTLAAKDRKIESIAAEMDSLSTRLQPLEHNERVLSAENRYLRKALREYLYPAIANEILKEENVLEQTDTDVTPAAMAALADSNMPASFSGAIELDKQMVSRSERLLNLMANQIRGDNNGET